MQEPFEISQKILNPLKGRAETLSAAITQIMAVFDLKIENFCQPSFTAIGTVIDNLVAITVRADWIELFVFPLGCDEKTLQGKRKILNWRCD